MTTLYVTAKNFSAIEYFGTFVTGICSICMVMHVTDMGLQSALNPTLEVTLLTMILVSFMLRLNVIFKVIFC